ncbi:MAG: DUF948 domain-containing protein [Proteocatella sp.]
MIWEVGILLAGIGILILCICAGMMLRDIGMTMKSVTRISLDKKGEIESIIENSASITGNIDTITQNAAKVTSIVTILTEVMRVMKEKRSDHKEQEEGEE